MLMQLQQERTQREVSREGIQQKKGSTNQMQTIDSNLTQESKDRKDFLSHPWQPSAPTAKRTLNILSIVVALLIAVNTVLLVRYIFNRQTPTPLKYQIRSIGKTEKIKGITPNHNTQSDIQSVKYYPYLPLHKSTSTIIRCKQQYFTSSLPSETYVTSNQLNIVKVPYAGLLMVQHSESPPLSQHYPDLVAALNQAPLRYSIYVHSAPPYAVLLMGAVSRNVSITICFDYPEKDQLLTAFVLNNMQSKLYFQRQADVLINRERAEVLVTTSVYFAEKYLDWKGVMIIADGSVAIPKARGLFKFSRSGCIALPPNALEEDTTQKGIYLNLKRKEPYFYHMMEKIERNG